MAFVTTDKVQLKVYVRDAELLDALKRAAKDDARSVSVLVDLILTKWLNEHGYLRGPKKRTKRSPIGYPYAKTSIFSKLST